MMKKVFLSVIIMMAALSVFAQQEMLTFEVKGPEKSYNQVKVVNETSVESFNCRVVVLNDDKTIKEVYGDYYLNEKGASDMNTKSGNRIKKGMSLGVQFMKNFPGKASFYVEYKDFPFFDVIVIHVTDKGAEYDE